MLLLLHSHTQPYRMIGNYVSMGFTLPNNLMADTHSPLKCISETFENSAFQTPFSNIKVTYTREGPATPHISVAWSASGWNLRGISQI